MSSKRLRIWIVEDDPNDAKKAFEAVQRVLPEKGYTVFWDDKLRWAANLCRFPAMDEHLPLSKEGHMPDIVVLDLLDADLQFAAGKYYEQLRKHEHDYGLPASFVIMWSVKPGLAEALRFFKAKLNIDRRLVFTNTKSVGLLEESLTHATESWREAQFL